MKKLLLLLTVAVMLFTACDTAEPRKKTEEKNKETAVTEKQTENTEEENKETGEDVKNIEEEPEKESSKETKKETEKKEKGSSDKKDYSIETRELNDGTVVVKYPFLMNGNDEVEEINDIIKKDVDNIAKVYEDHDFRIEVGYEVKLFNEEYLSIVYDTGSYMAPGAAHPGIDKYSTNIDLKKTEKIELKDIVTIDKDFAEKVTASCYDDYAEKFAGYDAAMIEQNSDYMLEILKTADFYLCKDGIGVIIPTAYAFGSYMITEVEI